MCNTTGGIKRGLWAAVVVVGGMFGCVALGLVVAHDAARPVDAMGWAIAIGCGLLIGVNAFAALWWLCHLAKQAYGGALKMRPNELVGFLLAGLVIVGLLLFL